VANTNTPILDMMSYSWGIISGSFLAPYVLGLYVKWLNRPGAWAGILGGFLVAVVPALCKLINIFGYTANGAINSLAAKGPIFAVSAMIFSIILCLAVSLMSGKNEEKFRNDFFFTGVVKSE
jgi:SSS family solute:Na+ symporter/sodium/proline symporter